MLLLVNHIGLFCYSLSYNSPSLVFLNLPSITEPIEMKRTLFSFDWQFFCTSKLQMQNLADDNHTIRILVIEDDEEMRSLLEDILDEEGFETESVSNGSDGLQKLTKEPFDLVITDIRMPGLTGLDILPIIKRLRPNASVIVITAFGNEEVYRRSFEKGAAGYLEKPIHMDKLKTLVHEMVFPKERMVRG